MRKGRGTNTTEVTMSENFDFDLLTTSLMFKFQLS